MFFAVTFIVFLGVMLFSSFYTSYLNIKETYNTFYEESEFEDAPITVVSAPSDLIKEIKRIDGVLETEGRLKVKASMKAEQSEIRLYLISLLEKPKINKLYFVEGGYFPQNSRSVFLLTKFSIRNLFRNKKRTAYSIFSVVASLMLIMVSMVFVDAVDFTMDLTFNKALNYDLDVRLAGYQSQDFLEDVRKIKGVSEAYPLLSGYFLIEKGGETKAVSLMGMPNQDLYRVFDGKGRVHLMPPKGISYPIQWRKISA